ncbi:MAG: aminotransferase class III-fold pyridoxal phosphate-dependent enzyme, partial [Hyphomicrobiaceae bacterium]|nr:aminotransferase class III-fold pyridoxal phosphate-dependent enzyme [Hyphomicrobiaceae bacterium]
ATKGMVAGTHGSTFGGNPLAMGVAGVVLDTILEPDFLKHVEAMALRLKQQLAGLHDAYPHVIEEVRGSGLLTGLKVKPPAGEVINAAADEKLLTVGAGDNVVRLLPPLNVSEDELSEAVGRLGRALARFPQPA